MYSNMNNNINTNEQYEYNYKSEYDISNVDNSTIIRF